MLICCGHIEVWKTLRDSAHFGEGVGAISHEIMDFVVKSVVMWVPRGAAGSTICSERKSLTESSADCCSCLVPSLFVLCCICCSDITVMTSVNSTPKANPVFYLWIHKESTFVYEKSMLEVDEESWVKGIIKTSLHEVEQ